MKVCIDAVKIRIAYQPRQALCDEDLSLAVSYNIWLVVPITRRSILNKSWKQTRVLKSSAP